MDLWRVTPSSFRRLHRPASLATSISPLAPLPDGYQTTASHPIFTKPAVTHSFRPGKRNVPRTSHDSVLEQDTMEVERPINYIQEWVKGVAIFTGEL